MSCGSERSVGEFAGADDPSLRRHLRRLRSSSRPRTAETCPRGSPIAGTAWADRERLATWSATTVAMAHDTRQSRAHGGGRLGLSRRGQTRLANERHLDSAAERVRAASVSSAGTTKGGDMECSHRPARSSKVSGRGRATQGEVLRGARSGNLEAGRWRQASSAGCPREVLALIQGVPRAVEPIRSSSTVDRDGRR